MPSSALVPWRRTISGTVRSILDAASTMPAATRSQRTIPPKTLTRSAFTFGSERMIRKPASTVSAEAVPPTSRKLAGSPPASLMRSIVPIASPAPLTMQPTLPSSLM